LETLALVACTRCQVEEFLEDCKSYLGMTQYETRSWVGWHHHMTLVGLAHLFVRLVQGTRSQSGTPYVSRSPRSTSD
jgi:SRSO17 transposase